MRLAVIFLGLGFLAAGQSVDSFALVGPAVDQVASDSKGNIFTLQEAGIVLPCSFCNAPAIATGIAVYQYGATGKVVTAYPGFQPGTPPFLVVDGHDRVYVGGSDLTGKALLVRPAESTWSTPLALQQFALRAIAFDGQDNAVVVGVSNGRTRIARIDGVSGKILADRSFGGLQDTVEAIASDAEGNVYLAGWTRNSAFPLTAGALQAAFPDSCGAADGQGLYGSCTLGFVTRLDASLAITYSTLLGGNQFTYALSIAAAADGSVYVGGEIITFGATDFPTSAGAFQTALPPRIPYCCTNRVGVGVPMAGFVARLNREGSGLIASTLIAANYSESVSEVGMDAAGNLIVIGGTASDDFPATGVWRRGAGPARGRSSSLFVMQMDPLLAGVQSSAVLPQEDLGTTAIGADGTVVAAMRPSFGSLAASSAATPTRIRRFNLKGESGPVSAVVNGASYLVENILAPGQLVTVFGDGLGPAELLAFDPAKQLPFAAGGTEVRIGGIAAPLLAVSAHQINAIVPYGIRSDLMRMEVRRNGETIFAQDMQQVISNPTALLRFKNDGGLDAIPNYLAALPNAINDDGTPNGPDHPAPAGSVVTIYATGFGLLARGAADGAPAGDTPSHPQVGPIAVATQSGTTPTLDAATIPGLVNAVVAVRLRIPEVAGGQLAFQFFTRYVFSNFLYVSFSVRP